MPKYDSFNTIKADVFFDILVSKDYNLLLPNFWERILIKLSKLRLSDIFNKIYDDFFMQTENEQAFRYLELVKNVAFLEYKISMIKQTLAFLYYSTTAREIRIDYIKALNEGTGINIDCDVDFSDEVKRILTENIGWLQNDLNFEKIELETMMAKEKGKQSNYIERLVELAVASPPNLTINQDMVLSEFVAFEKAIIRYNKSLQK